MCSWRRSSFSPPLIWSLDTRELMRPPIAVEPGLAAYGFNRKVSRKAKISSNVTQSGEESPPNMNQRRVERSTDDEVARKIRSSVSSQRETYTERASRILGRVDPCFEMDEAHCHELKARPSKRAKLPSDPGPDIGSENSPRLFPLKF